MIFAFTPCIATNAYTNVSGVLTNSVDSVYHDSRAAIDTLYHDGKSAVTTVYGDLKDGTSGIYPDVKAAIVSIGKAIGVAAEHVYMVLVKKYFVMGIKHAFVFMFGFIAFIYGLIGWKRNTKYDQPINYRLILPVAFIIGGLITLCNVNYDQMLMGLINPEYGAIDYILNYTKEFIK